jgi:hypothetical protein
MNAAQLGSGVDLSTPRSTPHESKVIMKWTSKNWHNYPQQ